MSALRNRHPNELIPIDKLFSQLEGWGWLLGIVRGPNPELEAIVLAEPRIAKVISQLDELEDELRELQKDSEQIEMFIRGQKLYELQIGQELSAMTENMMQRRTLYRCRIKQLSNGKGTMRKVMLSRGRYLKRHSDLCKLNADHRWAVRRIGQLSRQQQSIDRRAVRLQGKAEKLSRKLTTAIEQLVACSTQLTKTETNGSPGATSAWLQFVGQVQAR